MHNDLFTIGPFTFHLYGLMSAIGILAAYFFIEHRAKKKGLAFERAFGLLIYCLIFGYLGSKLLYFLTILPRIIEDPSLILRSLTDGWVVFGGILGGIFGGYIYCKKRQLPAWSFFDIGLTGVALAQGFGRVGCFFAGCCYGCETSSPFHTTFIDSQFAPNGVPLVPTQILSSAFDFLLFFFLLAYDGRGKKNAGEVTGLYLILYSLGRFVIEFWRGDLARGAVGALSTSQFISIFTFIAGVVIFVKRRKNGTPDPLPSEDDAETKEAEEGADA